MHNEIGTAQFIEEENRKSGHTIKWYNVQTPMYNGKYGLTIDTWTDRLGTQSEEILFNDQADTVNVLTNEYLWVYRAIHQSK